MKLNIRLWLQTATAGGTETVARLLQDPKESAKAQQMIDIKKHNHLVGRFKLLGQRLLIDHIKVVANNDKDLNAGLGKDLDDFVFRPVLVGESATLLGPSRRRQK